ncbi:MAG: hypothetical protein HYR78_03070, partial [Nitrospirae bacterium]|nr:hypothetical protein [Nitrospirota bacterium]
MIKTIFLLSVVFVFPLLIVCISAASADTDGAAVKSVDVTGLHSIKSEELLDILNIKIGDV